MYLSTPNHVTAVAGQKKNMGQVLNKLDYIHTCHGGQ